LLGALAWVVSFSAGGGQTVPARQGDPASQQRPIAPAPLSRDFRVVGYVAGWSIPSVIHPEKLTHINFAFAHIGDDGKVRFESPQYAAALKSLLALKEQNPRLKVVVSVGGWQAEGFSDAALTDTSRNVFARSAIDLLHEYDIDGIDLDWEYPGQGIAGIKYRTEDKRNFTLLLKTLRAQLDATSKARSRSGPDAYTLTIASADREYFDHTEMDRLHVYVDWINIMSYDFFNSLTSTTGHHAGLFPSEFAAPTDRSANASVEQHIAAGIPPQKLVLGVAFYGRAFAGAKPLNNGLNQPYERYEGDHSYADLAAKFIGRQGFVRYWDERAKAPYLWNDSSKIFITYDDPQSIREKANYVRDHHLGGMMFWELSQDRNDELLDVIVTSLHPSSTH
jgi:chitinase